MDGIAVGDESTEFEDTGAILSTGNALIMLPSDIAQLMYVLAFFCCREFILTLPRNAIIGAKKSSKVPIHLTARSVIRSLI